MQPYNLGAETRICREQYWKVYETETREKNPPTCLRVWPLWAACIAWAAQKAAKDGPEALGWLSQLNRRVSNFIRRLQPVGQLLLLPLHILGVRGAWVLAQLYAADLKCHREASVKKTDITRNPFLERAGGSEALEYLIGLMEVLAGLSFFVKYLNIFHRQRVANNCYFTVKHLFVSNPFA
jgi:hypothetical protein